MCEFSFSGNYLCIYSIASVSITETNQSQQEKSQEKTQIPQAQEPNPTSNYKEVEDPVSNNNFDIFS